MSEGRLVVVGAWPVACSLAVLILSEGRLGEVGVQLLAGRRVFVEAGGGCCGGSGDSAD